MSCCVLACENYGSCKLPNEVIFYRIPQEYHLKQLWTEAIGKAEWQLRSNSEVCSAHFRELDFTISETGEKVLVEGAVPSLCLNTPKDLQAAADFRTCRVCLGMDRKMYHIRDSNYHHLYKMIVGVMVEASDRLPQMLCWECTSKLMSFKKFKEKAQTSQLLLSDKLDVKNVLTVGDIKSINRITYDLSSHLTVKYNEPNEFDVHIDDRIDDHIDFVQKSEVESNQVDVHTDQDQVDVHTDQDQVDVHTDQDQVDKYEVHIDIDPVDVVQKIECNDIEPEPTNFLYQFKAELTEEDGHIVLEGDSDKKSEIRYSSDSKVDIVLTPPLSSQVSNVPKQSEAVTTKAKIQTVKKKVRVPNRKRPMREVNKKECENGERFQLLATPSSAPPAPSPTVDLTTFDFRILTLEEQLAAQEARATSAAYLAAPHKCEVCYQGFRSADKLAMHSVRHSDVCGKFACGVCKRRFWLDREVRMHALKTHVEQYSCKACDFVTHGRTTAVHHQQWHAGNTYTCPHCPTTLIKFTSYMSHLRIKHSSQFACELCGYTFVSKLGVDIHKAKRHLLDEKVELDGPYCEKCKLRFASDEAYQRHLTQSSVHSSDNDPKRIRNDWGCKEPAAQRKRRKKQYGPYCKECKLWFDNDEAFQTHLSQSSVHGSENNLNEEQKEESSPVQMPERLTTRSKRSIPCEQCGEQQEGFRAYAKHFRAAHPGLVRTKFRGNYMCEQCGKMFSCKALLQDHMGCHSGKKLFKCDTCDKTFSNKSSLQIHQLVHRAPEHPCPYCDRKFQLFQNCTRHVKTVHEGERQFQCEICDKEFTTERSRRAHVDHVHHKKPWPKRVRVRTRAPPAADRD